MLGGHATPSAVLNAISKLPHFFNKIFSATRVGVCSRSGSLLDSSTAFRKRCRFRFLSNRSFIRFPSARNPRHHSSAPKKATLQGSNAVIFYVVFCMDIIINAEPPISLFKHRARAETKREPVSNPICARILLKSINIFRYSGEALGKNPS